MPISIYTARQFNPKNIGTIYTLRYPEDGFIFYVGKTLGNPKYRLQAHISEANSKTNEFINLRKKKIITDILSNGKRPIMGIIEQIKIWTNYDSMFYDSQELYWINQYLSYGWDLVNVRINEETTSKIWYNKIIDDAKKDHELYINSFYFGNDEKGFPIYDLDKIYELGFFFSKKDFAKHWDYIIELDKYKYVSETTYDYSAEFIDIYQ